ncbi:hypothetical protein ACKC9G_04390 [Pokkaliibacter sp. CJK22405]|uniref:hypothetical protein n=1 Tax=Pokkaliibacter sp. CJK22405 TaxID=3384615 RepID=UPI00398533E6
MSTATNKDTSTTANAAAKAHEAIDRAAVHAERAEEGIRTKAGEMDEQMRAQYAKARAKGEEVCDGVSTYVRKHPVASLGMAFGAGVVLSALLRKH